MPEQTAQNHMIRWLPEKASDHLTSCTSYRLKTFVIECNTLENSVVIAQDWVAKSLVAHAIATVGVVVFAILAPVGESTLLVLRLLSE